MAVRRPDIRASDPAEDQKRRGPKPGQGTNAGDGAVDGSDRTAQGLANDGLGETRTFVGEGRAGSTRQTGGPVFSEEGRVRRPSGTGPVFALNNVTGRPSAVLQTDASGLYDAQGNPLATSSPVAQRSAAAGQGGGGFPGLTPPGSGIAAPPTPTAAGGRTGGGKVPGLASPMLGGIGPQPGATTATEDGGTGDGGTGAGAFADVNAIEEALRTGRAEEIVSQFLDLNTGQVRVQFPIWNGEEVFYGADSDGNQGYGVIDGEGYFVLAPGDIQNQSVAIREGIQFSREYLAATSADARSAVLNDASQRLSDELQRGRTTDAQDFTTSEREESQDFQEKQADLDRSFQERLRNEQQEFDNYWNERNQAFRESESAIDRQLQVALFEMNNGIRFGDFETARTRANQEIQLRNAQFALQLLQTIGAAPEMLLQMRESGFLEQVQQATGLNLSLAIGAVPDAEAGSALAQVDLPSLAEFQQMPSDIRDRVIVSLAARTGVKRETIVQEIQRRSSGIGLAAATDFRRVPVGA